MMIKIKRLIPIQLLCILLTSKTTFGNPNDEPFDFKMNVLIKWDHSLVGNQNWTGINERFELSLHHVDGQSGMTVQPPITIAKTGYDDLATLILPSQQIGIQNAAMEIEQRRKGKEKVGMVKFILRIQMSSALNLNRPAVEKELEKLPNENEVLICSFNKKDECKFVNYEDMANPHRKRQILFSNIQQGKETQFLKFIKIECANDTDEKEERIVNESVNTLNKSKEDGMEYDGPVCPSNKYKINLLVDGNEYNNVVFECDETIPFHKNIFHFSNDKCQLLKENETIDDLKNLQGLLKMLKLLKFSADFIIMMNELQKKNKSASKPPLPPKPSHLPNKMPAHLMNLSKQFSKQQNLHASRSNPISPITHSSKTSFSKEAVSKFTPEFTKQLANDMAPYFIAQLRSELSQAGKKPKTPSEIKTFIENSLGSKQSQSSNPKHGSSVAANLPTNSQPTQISGTSGQSQQKQTDIPQHAQSSHQSHQNPPIIDDSVMTEIAEKLVEKYAREQPPALTKYIKLDVVKPVVVKYLTPEVVEPILIKFLQNQRQQSKTDFQPQDGTGLKNLFQNLQQNLANTQSSQDPQTSKRKQRDDELVQIIESLSAGLGSTSQQPVEASASRKTPKYHHQLERGNDSIPMQVDNPSQNQSPSMQGHRPSVGRLRFRFNPPGSSNLLTTNENTKQLLNALEQPQEHQSMSSNLQMNAEPEGESDEQTNLGLGLMGGEEGQSGQKGAKRAKKN